jgi:anthranilate/para-aminobenzoate synthase component II
MAYGKKLTYDNPNIEFHILSKGMVEKWGDTLFAQLDGILAPGGEDSYPRTKYFKKEDCSFELTLEQLYQILAEKAEAYHIPYLGMCAGAQHLALYHGSTLGPLNSSGPAKIDFIPGTLSHFKALNTTQKAEALTECKLPPLTVLGDTAHSFGAYPDMLGASLELGARHHDKAIAMAYTHQNGILAATQFHPENFIGQKTDNAAPQLAWIQSFLDLAEMHHAYKHQGGISPVEYYANVKQRLEECMATQELDTPEAEVAASTA